MNYNYKENKINYLYLKNNMIGGAIDKKIYFIRHGETEYNKLKKSQGQEINEPLNATGIEQAEKTATYLKKFRFNTSDCDLIISSPMIRAKETAVIIAKTLGCPEPIEYMDDIMETKMGELSGLTDSEEPKKTYLKKMEDAENDILDPIEKYEIRDYLKAQTFFDPVIGNIGIERYEEVIERVKRFIEFLESTKHKKIIVVSHSGYYDALLKEMFNINVLPKGNMNGEKNCCICYCIYENDRFKMISPLNTEHLLLV